MRYPHWIQVATLCLLLGGALASVWFQLRPTFEERLTKTRRLRLLESQDGAAEGRSLGPALRTRDKLSRNAESEKSVKSHSQEASRANRAI